MFVNLFLYSLGNKRSPRKVKKIYRVSSGRIGVCHLNRDEVDFCDAEGVGFGHCQRAVRS